MYVNAVVGPRKAGVSLGDTPKSAEEGEEEAEAEPEEGPASALHGGEEEGEVVGKDGIVVAGGGRASMREVRSCYLPMVVLSYCPMADLRYRPMAYLHNIRY